MESVYTADLDEEWFEIPSVGDFIEKTSIIAFKTPLNSIYNQELKEQDRFHLTDLFQQIEQKGRELSAIINLTKREQKAYTKEDLEKVNSSVKLYRYPLQSKNIPDMETLGKIHQIMEEYDQQGLCIGVHCKHGLNRTGFIVCSYLMLKKGYTYQEAVDTFVKFRGTQITKQRCLKLLKKLDPTV